eukprot:264490-Rhodomonas_salina.1
MSMQLAPATSVFTLYLLSVRVRSLSVIKVMLLPPAPHGVHTRTLVPPLAAVGLGPVHQRPNQSAGTHAEEYCRTDCPQSCLDQSTKARKLQRWTERYSEAGPSPVTPACARY